ncbi:MAG: HEPN domain-containing protein [Candidatus Cloacimonetes bacterium]|nr:HEPN domain-containing protein [Candidatus Cloacimonadota bacterium]
MDELTQITYWLELAEYDLETAKAMLKTDRLLYVGFMCHQTIEKALKGYYVFVVKEPPVFTHRLTFFTEKTGLEDKLTELQKDFIDELEPLNIEARYPTYKEKLLKSLTKERCHLIIAKTEEFLAWVRKKMQ